MSGADDERAEVVALLVLSELEGVGLRRLGRVVERFGSADAALRAPRAAFAEVAGGAAARRRSDASAREAVDRALARADALGMRIVTWRHACYPAVLHHLADPPPVLFLSGRAELLGADAVAIVGARRATQRAREVAERLGRAVGEAGLAVVSGMALGVDGAAHRGALAAGADTVAVLGTGADVAYPRSSFRLFRDIRERGLLVSEFPPGTPALPHHFPRRNRILAALGRATVVVEAGEGSGSLITVDHALDLGKEVWAVPGPIEHGACVGSNRLLAEGARALVSVSGFVAELAPAATPAGAPRTPTADTTEGRVLAAIDAAALTVDEVAAAVGLPVAAALTLLTALELRGAVRRTPGMRFRGGA